MTPSRVGSTALPAHARTPAVVTVVLTAGLLVTACSSSGAGAGAGSTAAARTVEITLTADGCPLPSAALPAGPTTFHVSNSGADAVSEFEVKQGDRILGEKENIAPGLDGSFSLSLEPGDYTAYCPGAGTESTSFTVTAGGGASATSSSQVTDQLAAATKGYADYVKDQSAQLVRATTSFVAALTAGDVGRAKELYAPARVFYERIEPVAESFGDLDPQIDARAGDVPAAEWGGFHRIEQILWTNGTTVGTATYADKLLADVTKLDTLVQTATYQPAQLANGATELLDEVAKSKITGEEERYSRTDLVDFKANVDGSKQAFVLLLPALTVTDPALAQTVTERFAAVESLLAQHRSGDGFVAYTALTKEQVRALAQAVDALAEPLSQVAGKVVAG
jgi:iron uptake system component EfeO